MIYLQIHYETTTKVCLSQEIKNNLLYCIFWLDNVMKLRKGDGNFSILHKVIIIDLTQTYIRYKWKQ